MAPKPTTRIGVLLTEAVQLLDVSPIDIFGMLDPSYLSNPMMTAPLKAGAVPVKILYINKDGPGALQDCTASAALRIDAAISDPVCAPPTEKGAGRGEKTLDILMIPGPNPWAYEPTDAMNKFIRGHFESGTDVLPICTGIYPAAYAGILKGRRATGPRALVPELKKKFPEAKWEDKRWVHDGNLWCGGMFVILLLSEPYFFALPENIKSKYSEADTRKAGVSNGQDMVAAYVRNKWPGPTTEVVLAMAEVGERGQEYGISKASDNAWWLWTIVRAWMFPYKK